VKASERCTDYSKDFEAFGTGMHPHVLIVHPTQVPVFADGGDDLVVVCKEDEVRERAGAIELIHWQTNPVRIRIVLPDGEALKKKEKQSNHARRNGETAKGLRHVRMKNAVEEVSNIGGDNEWEDLLEENTLTILVVA